MKITINFDRMRMACARAAMEGDRSELVALLRSERPLTTADRHTLADYVEGKFRLRRGQKRSDSAFHFAMVTQTACDLVRQIKAELKADEAEQQLKREMRRDGRHYDLEGRAIDKAFEQMQDWADTPPRTAIENALRRAKRR